MNSLLVKPAGSSKDITDGGFFFYLGVFKPSKNYMYPPDFSNDSQRRFKMGFDMDLGNMFKVTDLGPMSIGLKATFLSGGYTAMKTDTSIWGTQRIINGSLPRLGPYLSFEISESMAFDLYYQAGPSYVLMFDRDWGSIGDGFIGLTHDFGFAYRLSSLSIGAGYRMGKVLDMNQLGEGVDKEFRNLARTNNLRVFIGIKV
ncbi:MAG: hypothetical protein H0V01_11970 [Bacteroidetes bacterium]|nr:hypothetical protein [Bacteroidota bacterium]HET6245201.1 hypothetical protein [Bacteroidia bacterium]